MRRYRLRIVLLSLGVVLGYGSALARFSGYGERGSGAHCPMSAR